MWKTLVLATISIGGHSPVTHPSMTGVVLMIFSAWFRKESEAQMASRDQNHQMINISRFLRDLLPQLP